ncbi:MAG: hypothetical protein J7L32_01215 [Thermoplasmata archaeon]|nr:hypothetical protein [Thermoplasmata archaeon]
MWFNRKPLVLMLVFLFIIAGIVPTVNASLTGFHPFNLKQKQVNAENSHPKYYITIHHFNGLTHCKTVKTIPYNVAMEIKQRFEDIDASTSSMSDKVARKLEVLEEYNILSNEDIQKSKQSFNGRHFSGGSKCTDSSWELEIFGIFGFNLNSGATFLFWSPVLLMIGYKGYFNVSGEGEFTIDECFLLVLMLFRGIIIMFPFVSPFGIVKGRGAIAIAPCE